MPIDQCRTPGCDRPAVESHRCSRHARTWRNHAQRCDLCARIIEDPATVRDFSDSSQTPAILGRTHFWPGPLAGMYPVRLGHCCERFHLLKNGRENLLHLSLALTVDPNFPDCWTWGGQLNNRGRPMFKPTDGQKEHPWLAYRAIMALVLPDFAPKRTHQLDHSGCRAADGSTDRNIRCVNPLHLKFRTARANGKRVGAKASLPIAAHATIGTMYVAVERGLPWSLEPSLLDSYSYDAYVADMEQHEVPTLFVLREKAGT